MKIKIDDKGRLWIKRADKFKEQSCPFNNHPAYDKADCGDWCPLFGEPEHNFGERAISGTLQLCKIWLDFETCEDERS